MSDTHWYNVRMKSDPFETFEIYGDSRINLKEGYEPPSDAILTQAVAESTSDIIGMALYLLGGKVPDDLNKTEIADVSMLSFVLPFIRQYVGHNNIHRFIDMPMFMYERWNKSYRDAVAKGIIEEEASDTNINEEDFNNMMEG
tara:strand:+ start:112 stop:540 length:429 start_codon:yes stop_codon:yes gene_type:complete